MMMAGEFDRASDTSCAHQALIEAREALQQRPRWGESHLRLAQALAAVGDLDGAAVSYRRAAELDGGLAEAASSQLAAIETRLAHQMCRATLSGYGGAVFAVAVCPMEVRLGTIASRPIATATASGAVQLWCSTTGALLQTLGGHTDSTTTIAWSPCSRLLASGSLDHTARLWAAQPPAAAWKQVGGGGDGAGIGTSLPNGSLQLMSEHAVLSGHTGRIVALAFSPDCSLLTTASADASVRLWDTSTVGACVRQLSGHGGLVTAVCFSPCGQLLATSSGDTHCRVWSVASGEGLHDIAWESGGVNHCCFVAMAAKPPPEAGHHGPRAAGPAAHAESEAEEGGGAAPYYLLTCHIQPQRREGRLLLWDLQRRQEGWVDGRLCAPCATIDGLGGQATSVDACPLLSDAGSAGGGMLLVAACADGLLRVYELAPGAVPPPTPHSVAGCKAARPGQAAKPPPALQPAKLFELPMGDGGSQQRHAPNPWAAPAWGAAAAGAAAHGRAQVALSPGAELLAVSCPDHGVRVVEADSGEEVAVLRGHSGAVRALCWLGRRDLLSAGEEGDVRLWRLRPAAAA